MNFNHLLNKIKIRSLKREIILNFNRISIDYKSDYIFFL